MKVETKINLAIILIILLIFIPVSYILSSIVDDVKEGFPDSGSGIIIDKYVIGQYEPRYFFVIDDYTHVEVDVVEYYNYSIGDFYRWGGS